MSLGMQLVWVLALALPIACMSWTWTHEEICREIQDVLAERVRKSRHFLSRKFCFALTCEFCVSFYVTLAILAITRFKFLAESWFGYVLAAFAIVWIANLYMTVMALLRSELKERRLRIEEREKEQKGGTQENKGIRTVNPADKREWELAHS